MNFFDSKYQNENSSNVKKLNSFNSVTDTTQMSTTLYDENPKDRWKLSFSPQEYEFNRFVDSKIEAFDFAPEFETKCYVIHSKSLRFDKNSSLEQNERANDIYKDECLSEAFDSCLNDDI